MTGFDGFLLLFALIYAAECAVWVPAGAHAALAWWGARGGMKAGRRLAFRNPWPAGFGFRLKPELWRFGRDGLHLRAGDGRGWVLGPSYARLAHARVRGTALRLAEGGEIELGDEGAARAVLSASGELAALPWAGRARVASGVLASRLDHAKVAGEARTLRRACAPLRWLGRALIVAGLVPVALLLAQVALLKVWLAAAALVLAAHLAVAPTLWLVHRRLKPAAKGERVAFTLMCLVSPWQAARAADLLEQGALDGYHPLAVARALAGEDDFRAMAEGEARRLDHPARGEWPEDEAARESMEWGWRVEKGVLLPWIAGQGLSWPDLVAAPPREGRSNTWCPRCKAQYLLAEGQCSDCGVDLREF